MRAREIITETKDLASFLAQKSPMVTVPSDGARADIFSSADRAAIERLVPAVRGHTDHEALEAGKEFLETFLVRIRDGAILSRQDIRMVQGLYDIIRRQTDRYDAFMRQHELDE